MSASRDIPTTWGYGVYKSALTAALRPCLRVITLNENNKPYLGKLLLPRYLGMLD